MPYPIISIGGHDSAASIVPSDFHDYQHVSNFRGLKKLFRGNKPAIIILCIEGETDIDLAKEVAEFVRKGLLNTITRLVVLRNSLLSLDEADLLEQFQINSCLNADKSNELFNKAVLKRELSTFLYIENNQLLHEAETNVLMCINRFSRQESDVDALIKDFSKALSGLSCSVCGFHINTKNNEKWFLEESDESSPEITACLSQLIDSANVPECLVSAMAEKQPQIYLLQEKQGLDSVAAMCAEPIGSYLIFPIVVYDHVNYLLLYLIPEKEMDKVSMRQINIINKAAEQITILLERKEAESSLKKQYDRLKQTLVELAETKEELAHNEKMASIGRMAAGIAHEINNPLSYVMSNFSSMDNYLQSILQLQELQAEFLSAIDQQQNQRTQELKQHIVNFEQEEDIPFILEDIRAIVTDSFNGLHRVKNIITDLKSLSHGQNTAFELCDIEKVVEETFKILKTDLGSVSVNKNIDEGLEPFFSHPGLLGQVFINLIKNAVQAMAAAHITDPIITIGLQLEHEVIVITVEDNGPGIPEDVQPKIFDPFFTTKPVGEGTGLGLSVTYNIVKKLEGSIAIKSEEGAGATFELRLPYKKEQA